MTKHLLSKSTFMCGCQKEGLLTYCHLDTLAMVKIYNKLVEKIQNYDKSNTRRIRTENLRNRNTN